MHGPSRDINPHISHATIIPNLTTSHVMSSAFPTKQIARLTGHNGILTKHFPRLLSTNNRRSSARPDLQRRLRTIRTSTPSSLHLHRTNTSQILTGSTDRQIRIFNPASSAKSKLIQTYSAHGYEVLDLAVAEANDRFISVGGDKTVFVWDVASAQTLRRFTGHAGRVNACAWGGEGDSVVVSGESGRG